MPSNDNIVREYIQGDIKNGQMFDAKYVDRMETGIEDSFLYSQFLESRLLPKLGELSAEADIDNINLEPGIYNLKGNTNANLPINTGLYGTFIVFPGDYHPQMIIASTYGGATVLGYFRRYLNGSAVFTSWTTFDTQGSAAKALSDSKIYTNSKATTLENKVPTMIAGSNITLDQLVAGSTNKVMPASLLPSYVDDVLEYKTKDGFPTTGETGKIYVDLTTNLTYRWSGSTYVEISKSLALGETSSTAYRGDYGAIAYNHASNKGAGVDLGLWKIGANSEGHVTEYSSITKSDITGLGIPAADTHYTTRIYAGTSGTAAHGATTSPYIKVTDNNTYRNQIQLVGSGATTVSSDANGVITISSTDTNTHAKTGITTGASGTTTNSAATDPYIKIKDESTHRGQIQLKGSGATTVSSDTNGIITISSTDTNTDTHYTTGITAGASGTTSNSAATNPYIKIKDNSTHRSQIQLKGSGATTVSSDANGVITISSTDNNSGITYGVVTASANGLTPKFDAADGTIDSSSTDWVLTNNNGSVGWYKLPATAFTSGNDISVSAALTSGTKIGTITVDGTATTLYAPSVDMTPITTTEINNICV